METDRKTKKDLIEQIKKLQRRIAKLEKGQRANGVLNQSHEYFRNLMDYIPGVAVQGYHIDGTVFYWNKACREVYGYTPEQAKGKNLCDLIIPDDLKKLFRKSLSVGSKIKSSGEFMPAGELMLLHKKGHLVPIYSMHTAVKIAGEKPLLFCIDVDLSERKKVEEALRQSQHQQRSILDSIPDIAWLKDKKSRFIAVNEPFGRSCGYRPEDLVGKTDLDIWPRDLALRYRTDDRKVMRTGKRVRVEEPLQDATGKRIWIETIKTPIYNDKGQVIGTSGIARNVTDRKLTEEELQQSRDELESRVQQRTAELARTNKELRSEIGERKKAEKKLLGYQAQLRSLASELSLSEERLRRKIATDVHDHIGQNLAISKIKIESLAESASLDSNVKALREVRDLIGQTIEITRSLTFELSPPVLYELGFEAAVEWLVRKTREQQNLLAEFRGQGSAEPLNDNLRVLLFQAVRELLVNVVKHAQARNVVVSTQRVNNEIQVCVEDDGVGFDVSEIHSYNYKKGGFGLFSIRERLGHIGGSVEINSEPGQGTCVTLLAPVNYGNKMQKEI